MITIDILFERVNKWLKARGEDLLGHSEVTYLLEKLKACVAGRQDDVDKAKFEQDLVISAGINLGRLRGFVPKQPFTWRDRRIDPNVVQ